MPKRVGIPKTDVTGALKGKVRAYAVLYRVNEGFEQILAQLQELDSDEWLQISKRLQVVKGTTYISAEQAE